MKGSRHRFEWWPLAKEWAEASRDLPHGVVQARLAEFSRSRGIADLTVRRAAAALRFAERLAQQGRLDGPELLEAVAITYLEILQRIDRIDPRAVDRLLPRLVKREVEGGEKAKGRDKVEGPELRALETALRWSARSRRGEDAGLLRMGAEEERKHVLDRLAESDSPLPGHLVRLKPSRAFRPLVLDAVVIGSDGGRELLHGVRVFTAVVDAAHPRNVGYAALLGLSGSRVLDSFYLVFEDGSFAADAVKVLRGWETAGVGIICVSAEGTLSVDLEACVREEVDPGFEAVRKRFAVEISRQRHVEAGR